jgi:hypothetical protein
LEGNSNPNASRSQTYASMRAGSLAGPDFSAFKQQADFKPPQSLNMAGLQKENLQSGAFAFRSADVSPGKVASYSKYQRGTFYGAGMDNAGPTPINPGG